MVYYILLPADKLSGTQFSTNILGESSFKNFWTDTGFKILVHLIESNPDVLDDITIKDSKSQEYTIEQFLQIISKLNIIRN